MNMSVDKKESIRIMSYPMVSQSLRKFLKAEELGELFGVRTRWIYDNVMPNSSDPIPHIRLGKYIRFNPDCPKFKAWLERHSVAMDVDNDERYS